MWLKICKVKPSA